MPFTCYLYPLFTWFKSNFPAAQARFAHSCNLAADDSRQIIVVGGYQYYDNIAFYDRDVFTQGLALFDVSEMSWKDRYNADAAPYATPRMIKEHYGQNGREPQTGWADSTVESWFLKCCQLHHPFSETRPY